MLDCTHRRGVCLATGALMNGEHRRYLGRLEWCPDCGAFRAVSSESGAATAWLQPRSVEVEAMFVRFKQRRRQRAAQRQLERDLFGVGSGNA